MSPDLELEAIPGLYAVARLEPTAALPDWASGIGAPLVAVTRTARELSVVCPDESVPDGVRAERGYRALAVAGPLDFSQTGVLASLTAPLARAGIPALAISTYDTDILLVQDRHLDAALGALQEAGSHVRVRDAGGR